MTGLRNSGALPISRVDILGGRITKLFVYTYGLHETQPPEERGGQYGQCTEYVKHKVKMTGYQYGKSKQNIATHVPI